ncbi:MAG: hypothetical protein CMI55_01345 [Parcubacteria group bacterium]|jgi:hypothetical protein|nr:hypothetical protein [Parcubacteria group bacterium]|tara:strand:+ start:924 stop:1370 length:447 start_codon:yes stop_codon:yes gene_type:complete
MIARAMTVFFIMISISFDSFAGELSYTCKVTHVYNLEDDGSLKASVFEKNLVGSQFSVSRVTGEIIGEVIPTLMANSTKVINVGDKEYSFKSIAYFDAVNKPLSSGDEDSESTAGVQVLEIQEFRDGDTKPFVSMSMSGAGIVTGLCE